jgi:hypothetical protein
VVYDILAREKPTVLSSTSLLLDLPIYRKKTLEAMWEFEKRSALVECFRFFRAFWQLPALGTILPASSHGNNSGHSELASQVFTTGRLMLVNAFYRGVHHTLPISFLW